tara:strand:- start:36 stop:293 length:258 start_codon:yes stop_codon:yes gene_type:complete
MKKTEWFYNHNKEEWWMVNVSTNAKHIPKIRLGDKPNSPKPSPIQIKGINLYGENKKLYALILALAGCLGVSLAAIVVLVSVLLK